MIRRLLLFAGLLANCLSALAQPRLLPVDEAASVADFFRFRVQLLSAAAKRDAGFVLGVLSKEVKLSFGGDTGVEDFKRMWKPDEPDSQLWTVLGSTLALGGTFAKDGTFTAPYLFTNWPRGKDAFTHMASIAAGVRVRSASTATAAVVGSLDFSIVELVGDPAAGAQWIRIRIAPDRTGFVDARYLRSPIDYRIRFAKMDGRWQMVSFLAGD